MIRRTKLHCRELSSYIDTVNHISLFIYNKLLNALSSSLIINKLISSDFDK